MLRNLGIGRLIGLILLGAWWASDVALFAQEAAPADGAIQSIERVDRDRLTRPDLRAAAVDPNTGTPVDPRIDALLQEWSDRTKQIKRLQGRHLRATLNFTFGSESWAEGQFYVETPDKGRIDVRPFAGKLPDKTMPRKAPNGRMVDLTIQRDSKHDRWICDGKEIKAINDDDKTYEAVKIPPSQRGVNIMDGPLPFLFGMPPDKAKARYEFKLLGENKELYSIEVRPKFKQDAIDWTQAELLLDRKTCLPQRVHLHNAAGSTEQVYIFRDLQVNRIKFFFWSDPFEPSLYTYKRSVHNTPNAGPSANSIATNKMPSLIGMPYAPVKKELERRGYDVKLMRGDPATDPKQVFHVEQQEPPPDAPLDTKSPIILTLYVKMAPDQPQSANRPDYRYEGAPRTTAKPADP